MNNASPSTNTLETPQVLPDNLHQLCVVIPSYNAGTRLAPVVKGVQQVGVPFIVVDDGSSDGSVSALSLPDENVLHLPENRGKGHALLAGFRKALENNEIAAACVVDADGQHNPQDIPRFWATYKSSEADFITGVRSRAGTYVPLRSRFGNWLTVHVTSWLLGRRLPDTQCGFRLMSRHFTETVLQEVDGGRYETEMEILVLAIRRGFSLEQVSIATVYESGNPSSHFNKFLDSYLIYRRLWAAIRKYRRKT